MLRHGFLASHGRAYSPGPAQGGSRPDVAQERRRLHRWLSVARAADDSAKLQQQRLAFTGQLTPRELHGVYIEQASRLDVSPGVVGFDGLARLEDQVLLALARDRTYGADGRRGTSSYCGRRSGLAVHRG